MSVTLNSHNPVSPCLTSLDRKHLSCLLFALMLLIVSSSRAALAEEDVLQQVGIPANKVARLLQGKVVSHELVETTDKEMALSTAIYLDVAPAVISDFITRGEMAAIDPDVIAYAEIPAYANTAAFKRFAFSAKQHREVDDFLDDDVSESFNLSANEIASLSGLHENLKAANAKTRAAAVSEHYRQILLQRVLAYQSKGLAGIADYAREDGKDASPASELRNAVESSQVLKKYYPALYQAWLGYPANIPGNVIQHFYWLNRKVQNRPTAILGHRMVYSGHKGTVMVSRQFYAGHSYNSGQLILGALPFREGTLVFYRQRSSTDQVAGLGSGLKRNIGRGQMKQQMVTRLERLRKQVAGKANMKP